jgi:hypothetical protein
MSSRGENLMNMSSFPDPPFVQPCGAITPPSLPNKFHAVALLTPFTDSQLVVADIYYDWSVQAMRVTTYGLERGYADLLYIPSGYYILDSVNGGDPTQCFGPINTTEKVPAPSWLMSYNVTCNGVQKVLGVNTNWWCGLMKNLNPPAPVPPTPCPPFESANWFWMRTDNQYPWRMMFINTTNDYKLPFIGRFAFIHFPTFASVTGTNLPSLIQDCTSQSTPLDEGTAAGLHIQEPQDTYNLLNEKSFLTNRVDRAEILGQIQNLIPGLTAPTGNEIPPSWPARLFMTALTTPTFEPHPFSNQPYPTQVYYDWTNLHQLTRFYLPDTSLEDAILTSSTTYLIARFTNGTHKCLGTVPVGLPYMNWPTHEGTSRCKGVITNNPQLSPNKTTQIFIKNSQPPRYFWFWYTTTNQAIMFAEIPQACNVELVLTDYFDFMPNPSPFDPSLFVVPPDCLAQPVEAATKPVAKKTTKKAVASRSAKKATSQRSTRKTAVSKVAKKAVASKSLKKPSPRKTANKSVASKASKKSTSRTTTKKAVVRRPAIKSVSKTLKKRSHRNPARKTTRRKK